MHQKHIASLVFLFVLSVTAKGQPETVSFDFLGKPVSFTWQKPSLKSPADAPQGNIFITDLANTLNASDFGPINKALKECRESLKLDDWLFYQLVRATAQRLSPKADNYYSYTIYKWFLLTRSGYDATIRTNKDKILFYVHTDDNIYNIPFYTKGGQQYVCLNYHDYGNNIDFKTETFADVNLASPGTKAFSYKISSLPEFKADTYVERDIQFSYYQDNYQFKIKLNPQVKTVFANYPATDYASYFNIPLSAETYSSLIPLLKQNTSKMDTKGGVDYLMRFTRYAFMFKPDSEAFGAEKRLSPEQTLLYPESDCEDRAALFFYLVKEIYNLPMIVLSYPQHVTIAIKFDKPIGKPVIYNGEKYSICEPTPQKRDLAVGQQLPALKRQSFEVAYAYTPAK